MTRIETINYLREQEKKGNNQVIDLIDILVLYLPRIFDAPGRLTSTEISQYNSLVRAHVYEKELLDKLIMQ